MQITSITIPEGVVSISERAFARCRTLSSIYLPNSLITIDKAAFSECNNLSSITIPENVNSIGSSVFSNCNLLQAINVDEKNTNYSSIDGVLFDKNCTTLITFPPCKDNIYYS